MRGGAPSRGLSDFYFAFMLFQYTGPLEEATMSAPKFCSECGEKLEMSRARLLAGRATCARCAPRHRALRFVKVASLALLVLVAFAIGRYGTPPRTVYLIGTPIAPIANAEPDTASTVKPSSTSHATQSASSADEVVAICGAPTKSGKPCQRKVKGGGYCWQHRDKYGQKKQKLESR